MLTEAIQHLYDVFRGYEPGTLHESCTCGCITREQIEALRSKELRKLTADELSYYSFKAITTFGKVRDYKHFLPRLCELIATESYPHNTEIVLAGKLEYANFINWPDNERAAVEQYLYALWDDLLHHWPYHTQVDDVLCNIALILGSPAGALDSWSALLPTQRSARLHLADWLSGGPGSENQPPPFWAEAGDGWAQVVAWQKSPAVASVMESALVEWADTDEGAKWCGTPMSPEILERMTRPWREYGL